MADEPNVAVPATATASRAMTAPPASPARPRMPGRRAFPPRTRPHGGPPRRPRARAGQALGPRAPHSSFPVLILAALGYGGKTAYDYFVEGRFLVSTDDAYVGADDRRSSPPRRWAI